MIRNNHAALPLPGAGEVIQFSYPFVRDTFTQWDEDGESRVGTWKPCTRFEHLPPEGDTATYADGIGQQVITVIGTYKPGKFPMRVFFTRQWRDPSGKIFGKTACRVLGVSAQYICDIRHGRRKISDSFLKLLLAKAEPSR